MLETYVGHEIRRRYAESSSREFKIRETRERDGGGPGGFRAETEVSNKAGGTT